jgi:hypothetical protein
MMHASVAEQRRIPSKTEGPHGRSSEVLYKDSVLLMQEDAKNSEVIIPAVIDLLKTQIESNDRLVLPPGKTFVTNISVTDFLGRKLPCCSLALTSADLCWIHQPYLSSVVMCTD